MGALWQDLRYSFRMLLKSPGFTVVAVLTLALGIGANTAIFSLIDAVLLKPLPFPRPEQLVAVYEKTPGGPYNVTSAPTFLDWREQGQVFSHLAAVTGKTMNLSGVDPPEALQASLVSANYFDLLGVRPILGRGFLPDEEQPGKNKVVILSHQLWKRRFAADLGIVSKPIILNGESYAIVGVLPPVSSFDKARVQIWTPLVFTPEQMNRRYVTFSVAGRLKDGVTLEQARAQMNLVAEAIQKRHPRPGQGWGVTIIPLRDRSVREPLRHLLFTLLGAVGFVLLIACANVATLLMARGAARQREVAVRAALGAPRGRLVRQFLTESMLLALLGGAASIFLAAWLVPGLTALMPPYTLPPEIEVVVDRRVMAFTLGLSMLSTLLFGAVPAWQNSKSDLVLAMKEGGLAASFKFHRSRFRSFLVIAEIALSFILLVGAGLLVRSFVKLLQVDPGFQPENVLTFSTNLPERRYMEQWVRISVSQPRFTTVLLALFASLALLLSAVGIFGVMFYTVTQRTREIGIRMALGAQARDVLGMVLRQGMRLIAAGLALGMAGGLALTRVLGGFLFGIRPTDPTTYLAVLLLLGTAGLLACYIPARRATKIDPMIALRYE